MIFQQVIIMSPGPLIMIISLIIDTVNNLINRQPAHNQLGLY